MPTSVPLLRAHLNRQLFSNHFLENRLRQDPLWHDSAAAADTLRQELRELIAQQRDALGSANEAQTEERFIRPVLRALGWAFEVQPESKWQGATHYPDYALFGSQEALNRAVAKGDPRHVLKDAHAVLEAKRWQRGLDALGTQADSAPNRVPSTQIINYLVRTQQPWGLLANGSQWRLYFRDADFADTVFFAVDLPKLLGDDALALGEAGERIPAAEAFRYFHLFFRPQAFVPDASGLRWVDAVRHNSTRYARAVEEALRPRAYRAVTALCRGFVAADGRPAAVVLGENDAARTILDNALTVLFRLLFLLYAESRDLLPVRTNAAYRSKSLHALRERAARLRDSEESAFPRGRDFWNDLSDLFAIVHGADEWRGVGVPVYNGALFDPEQHPWLEQHYVTDPHLAEAIDLLSRAVDPDGGQLHFVDYDPLDVRHLGTIYEGLLEHVIRIADEPLPAVRASGTIVRDPVQPGDVYLATESGERKTTGSFYTPDYIAQYVVDRTLGPLVEGRQPDEILSMTVLDPAMGSGHFLVAATSYLARAAVNAVETGDQRLLGDFAQLDPEWLRRLVVERCIFGVDRNPRAVELAKLALWLVTVQQDKPLNFLDHHLRCGDSLLGGRTDSLGVLPRAGKVARLERSGQYNAFDGAFRQHVFRALALIREIEALPSETVDDIELKKARFAHADALLERFRDVADAWCATLLGADVNADQYDRALLALHQPDAAWDALRREDWFAEARVIARRHRCFHWEIEFAEVFLDARGAPREDAGFDAIVGNPPYVRMEQFKEIKDFLKQLYETYATRSDLYVYFMERSIELLRDGGEYGVIVSNKFLRAEYGRKLRRLISREMAVREIVDFGGLPVFPDATVRPAIALMRRGRATDSPRFAAIPDLKFDALGDAIDGHAYDIDPRSFEGDDWVLAPARVDALLRRLEEASVRLGECVDRQICWGVKTGLNAAFYIDGATRHQLIERDPRSAELIKPLVVGDDVRHYYIRAANRWLIYVPHGSDLSRYPAVAEHLEPFRTQLEKRATSANHAWYELQQPQQAYQAFFESAKILYPEITRGPRFALHTGPLYPNNKCFLIPTSDAYLLAILNSRASFFFLLNVVAQLEGRSAGDRYLELRTQYMERLPIRRIEPSTPAPARRELTEWLTSLYYGGLRRAGIPPELPDDILQLGARLGDLPGIERVVLVGSWARGSARAESDVDLVVVDRPDGDRARRYVEVRTHIGRHARGIDLLLFTPEELERQRQEADSFVARALREGIELYAR